MIAIWILKPSYGKIVFIIVINVNINQSLEKD